MLHTFDLHLHTHYSADAYDSPEAMIKAAKQRGLSGIAITDHNNCEALDHLMRVGLMHSNGEAVDDFLIIPGVEVSTSDGHLLCLGTTLPQMKGKPSIEVRAAIKERGGLAIAPHPCDLFRRGIRKNILDQLDLDALETFNAAVSMKRFNAEARVYARDRGLAETAASDAHYASAAGISSTSYILEKLSLTTVLEAIPKGGSVNEHYLPCSESIKKNLGNWFRWFYPSPKPLFVGSQKR